MINIDRVGDDLRDAFDEGYAKGKADAVRHGKWVVAGNTTHYYICSVCGEPGDEWDNYCRSCGSRMEGAEE